LLKEHWHGARVKPGLIENLQADTVGFAFMLARIVYLALDSTRLGRLHGSAGQLRVGSCGQQPERHGGIRFPGIILLLRQHARQVTLYDVADFVRQHASQFRFAGGGQYQAGVHTDDAARHGKCVDTFVPYHEKSKVLLIIRAVARQAVAESLQIINNLDVIHYIVASRDIAQDFLTDALFVLRSQYGLRHFSQVGQAVS